MVRERDPVTVYGRGNRQHGLLRPCGLLRQICIDQVGQGRVVIQYVRSGSCRNPIRLDEGKTCIGRSDISDKTKSSCAHRSTLLLETRSDGSEGTACSNAPISGRTRGYASGRGVLTPSGASKSRVQELKESNRAFAPPVR